MTEAMPRVAVLRTLTQGAPSEPVPKAGIHSPFEVFGFTQAGQTENPYNTDIAEIIFDADHLFIEQPLVEEKLPQSVIRAISAAMSGRPSSRNIWVFSFDSPDPPGRLSEWVKGRTSTQQFTNQHEGEA